LSVIFNTIIINVSSNGASRATPKLADESNLMIEHRIKTKSYKKSKT